MNPIQEIIQKAQRDLYCPTCGRNFNLNEIKLRGLYNNTVLLQAVCSNGHSPVIMIFVASYKMIGNIQPITTDDVLKAHKTFKNFDGDFISLWKRKDK